MGEEPGAERAPVTTEPGTERAPVTTAETRDPEEIREDIEATRQELGDTVEALAAKADVKARMRDKFASTKQSAAQKLGKARESSPDSVTSGATQVAQKAKQNPVPVVAIGAFAGGFIVGRMSSRS